MDTEPENHKPNYPTKENKAFDSTDVDTWTVIGHDSNGRFLIRTSPFNARVYNLAADVFGGDHPLEMWLELNFKPYIGPQEHLRKIFRKHHK